MAVTEKIKKTWKSQILMMLVSVCFTSAIAFIKISSSMFVYSTAYDYIYCIVGGTNIILWVMTVDRAKIAVQQKQLSWKQLIVLWYAPLILYFLYYAYFPILARR